MKDLHFLGAGNVFCSAVTKVISSLTWCGEMLSDVIFWSYHTIENTKKSSPNSDIWKILSKGGKKEKKEKSPVSHEDTFS